MNSFQAFLLGLVEGITEYLPVSSTGHLLVVQRLLGIPESRESAAFAICIQAGAIAAVFLLYSGRIRTTVLGALGRHPDGRRLFFQLVAAFIPAAVVGLLFDDAIEQVLFGPWPIVAAWTAGAAVILALGQHPALLDRTVGKNIEGIDVRTAALVGLCQCLALWPGTSRSLATILGGVLLGMSLPAAVEFSFLLGLLTLGAATAWKAMGDGAVMVSSYGWGPILVGFLTAGVSAFAAVRWMVDWLGRRGLALFAWWRLAAAALVTAWMLTGAPS